MAVKYCITCEHYEKLSEEDLIYELKVGEDWGKCHRYPPQVVEHVKIMVQDGKKHYIPLAKFPRVKGDVTYCGEHKNNDWK